jgi:RimJ/RimL family protein N-acetyltransferase
MWLAMVSALWPHSLQTTRLTLRPADDGDREDLRGILCNEKAQQFLGHSPTHVEVEPHLQPPFGRSPSRFVIIEDGTSRFVGTCSVDEHSPDRPRSPRGPSIGELEVSYVLLPAHWSRGHGREAVAAVVDWVASWSGEDHVIAVTQTANHRSVRLLQASGFELREHVEEFGEPQSVFERRLTL